MLIAIVDYGMGNLRSVEKALEHLGYAASVTRDRSAIATADGVVLPGVGAFGAAMHNLASYGLIETVREGALSGRPFLGICLGMQLLMEESEEQGSFRGLGVIPGKVLKFFQPADANQYTSTLKTPNMGWNPIRPVKPSPLLKGVPDGAMVYFVHSYYVAPEIDVVAATTSHGISYCSVIWQGNLHATQFHPEKSGAVGLVMLRNFAEETRCK